MSKACKHILIVDDAATVRMFHRSILEEAAYAVTEAVNGLEALEKTASAPFDPPFDLYLVDVNMPQMDGYGFLRALRAGEGPQAPAIMISTEAEDSDRRQAFEAGANHYLAKPIRPQQLLRIVRLLLGESA
ncbi:response regulator [Massilia sp. BSC265]|uniref:response regulator n=1 Tax=Massilia sp. BSC265 TaxID=1549812 RepID=UPI0004E94763|nr:response regulator [Massilia sp. BSC265]KFI08408.1 chemotaxis protein CheY [Massilia sp. BSC265]